MRVLRYLRAPKNLGVPAARSLAVRARRDSLLRNSLYIMVTTLVNSAFGYVFWVAAARLYDPTAVGLASALIAVGTVIALVSQAGASATLIQTLPRQRNRPDWWLSIWTVTALSSVTCLVLTVGALAVIPFIAHDFANVRLPTYIVILLVGTLAVTVGSVLDSAFVAERASGNMLGRNTIVAAVKAVVVIALALVVTRTPILILDAWATAGVAGFVVGSLLLWRRAGSWHRPSVAPLLRSSRQLAASIVANQFIGLGGALPPLLLPLLVTARLSARDNAFFYTTWMMCGILLVVSPAVAQSLFAEGVHSPAQLRAKTWSALRVLLAIMVPGIVIFLVLGGPLLSTFGQGYEQHSIALLRIVVFSAIPDAVTNVYVSALRVRGRLVRAAWLNVAMGVGTLIISWILLPSLGIEGVGWAWLMMQTAGSVFVLVDYFRGGWIGPRLGGWSPEVPGR